MAAVLEGLVLRPWDGVGEPIAAAGVKLVPLSADKLVFVPITNQIYDQVAGVADGGEPVLGFYALTSGLAEWIRSLSHGGVVAYVHMEFFGGTGFHAAVAWRDGAVCWGPLFTQSVEGEAEDHYEVVPDDLAINQVLRWFGVARGDAVDEFAAAGLGRYRSTEEWVSHLV
jgi:hypothetical protein